MLTDGGANAQDNGKMQQEVFGLATILLSKLEKHSTPKQGKGTHRDGGAAASQRLNCEQGSENQPRGRGRPWSGGAGTEGPTGVQAGERILWGHQREDCVPPERSKGPDKRQLVTRAENVYLSSTYYVLHQAMVKRSQGVSDVCSGVHGSQGPVLTRNSVRWASAFLEGSWEQSPRTGIN